MYTSRYRLLVHLLRQAGHDTYLACPLEEPKRQLVIKFFDTECIMPQTASDQVRQLETQLLELKHPHIVAVLELGIEQGRPYIVSEYQSGGSLRQYLKQHASGHLSLEEAVGVTMQVGQALAFAHAHDMLHLGIRPENILLNEQGKALLADFRLRGFIQEPEQKESPEHPVRNYLAPEQLSTAPGQASDQYALGCLLYELITGIVPDPPVLRQRTALTPLVAPTTQPELPRHIEAVILRALAIKPRERYPDVTAFLTNLNSAVYRETSISPFTRFIQGEQSTELVFPPLLPGGPLTPGVPLVPEHSPQREEKRDSALPAASSLEAFLKTTEWEGVPLLERLAQVDEPESGNEEKSAKATYQSDTKTISSPKRPGLERRRSVLLLGIAVLLTLTIIVGSLIHVFGSSPGGSGKILATPVISGTTRPGPRPTPVAPTAVPTPSGAGRVQINVGGPAVGLFAADEDFTDTTPGRPSSTTTTSAVIDTSGVSNPAPEAVYQSVRIGDFLYTIPQLTPGASYTVRLHFAEIYWTQAGQRIFNVFINTRQILANFDIFAAAGGADLAIVEQFTVTANSDGTIAIQFVTVTNNALISGIEVLPA